MTGCDATKTTTMKATELRIGNWVEYEGSGKHVQVEGIERDHHCPNPTWGIWYSGEEDADYDYETEFNPIPLTAAVLEKCGFAKTGATLYYDHFVLPNRFIVSLCMVDIDGGYGHRKGNLYHGDFHRPIMSLHQLMNLYHSLTGEELDYKP